MNVNACPFIDYQKVFDCVQHEKLKILRATGIDKEESRIIKNLNWNQTAEIKVQSNTTNVILIIKISGLHIITSSV